MPRHEWDRRPGERVADEDHVVLRVRHCVGDELGVPRQPGGGVFRAPSWAGIKRRESALADFRFA
jgi:hypothetical protein